MRASRLSRNLGLLGIVLIVAACGSSTPPTQPNPTPDPPQVTCPPNITQTSQSGGPVVVTYQLPVAVNGAPPVTVGCAPASGTSFAPGTTIVTCTATDALARVGTCGFTVRITLPPKLQKTRFMAFGDSMTVGVVSLRPSVLMSIPSPASYPGRLQVLLADRYTAQTPTVDDQGVSGEQASNAVSRFRDALRATQPEVVLLLEGANDLNYGGTSAIESAESAMGQMVVLSLQAGAIPFLASIPPQREGGYTVYHPEAVVPYNDRMKAVADYYGATFVDLHAGFGGTASTELIGPDGLHPTEAGYQKMADIFFAAIAAKLEVPASTAPASRYTRK
jgi:lysophospholipase L1-like esterase